jgi:oligosaccharyltransferase complex subunit delta (ribophorin II)
MTQPHVYFQWANLRLKVPHLFSVNILPFTVLLASFEGLLFWYWVNLKLGQVLLYGGILSVVAVLTGKNALVTIREHRLAK